MNNLLFKCKNCKFENILTSESEFNLTKNIALYSKINDDSLFTFECSRCNAKEVVEFDSSFFDNDYGFYIRLSTDSNLYLLNDGTYKNVRVVSSLNELKEKLRIFYLLLDDFIIEIIKYLIVEDLNKNNLNLNINEIYFHKISGDSLSFIIFNKHDYLGNINYKYEGYLKLSEVYKEKLDRTEEHVNLKYVKSILKEEK